MGNKNLYFISAILFLIVFAGLFFFIGTRWIRTKKAKVVALVIIGIAQIALIQYVWIKGYDLMWLEKGAVSGLSGCMIGLLGSGFGKRNE